VSGYNVYGNRDDTATAAAAEAKTAAAAEAKTAAEREAKRKRDVARAVAAGTWPADTPDKSFRFPYNKAKGGVIKKFAKGGSIDGCAIRGKTRAPRTR
jgi:hypothetical protein